jgi:hypothetical protein
MEYQLHRYCIQPGKMRDYIEAWRANV